MLLCRIVWICVLITYCTLQPDVFSAIAEQDNVLDQLYRIPEEPTVQLAWSGYVKAEALYDSRQVFGFREDQILFYPENKLFDARGVDINARGTFDTFAIQSRLNLAGFGPDVGCTQTGFFIEADFLGRTDITINEFALRQAFITLHANGISFLAGQTWHPLCIPIDFPNCISFNQGIPMCPFALQPQFRFIFSNDTAELIISAISFIGDRPFGPSQRGARGIRDSLSPDFNILFKLKQSDNLEIIGDFDIMRILPRLVTNRNFRERNPFTAISGSVVTTVRTQNTTWYLRIMHAQDAAVFEMIGGYAVHTLNPITDERTYAPLNTFAVSSEFIWEGDWEPGLFLGYVKNMGASKTIIPNFGPDNESSIFSLGPDIDHVYRISPRIRYYHTNFTIGMELEYTSAAYGTITTKGNVVNASPVGNTRFLFATYYVF